MRVVLCIVVEVGDGKEEKGEVEGEEEGEECDSGFEGAQEEDEGEDEPALPANWLECKILGRVVGEVFVGGGRGAYEEIEGERVVKGLNTTLSLNCLDDLKSTGSQDDGKGEPEAAVRGEGCGAKGVANCHFPAKIHGTGSAHPPNWKRGRPKERAW